MRRNIAFAMMALMEINLVDPLYSKRRAMSFSFASSSVRFSLSPYDVAIVARGANPTLAASASSSTFFNASTEMIDLALDPS